ncbi:MAG: LD-carboxypeptidase [Schleiferiaceae bacterium]
MHLTKKDKIGLVSTARKISEDELQPAINLLKSWGLDPVVAPEIFEIENQFAGSDAQRTMAFQRFLEDEEIKAILCVRGGYGSVRIIDQIDFSALERNPKWIVGYSDVSVFHLHCAAQIGIPTLHATMPINFASNSDSALVSLRKALFGENLEYEVPSHPFNIEGSCQGELIGGNLSIVYSVLGSPSMPPTSGKILFLEDLDEYLYHIDRMIYNLKRNGALDDLAGIVIGGMTDMNDNTVPFGESAEEIIKRHVQDLGIPVAFGFPAGHLDDNRTLIMGQSATLTVGNTTHLKW